jgi:arsenate reductase
MSGVTIYHNPRCSKSREGLALLQGAGLAPKVVEYLREPPSEAEILAIIAKLDQPPAALVRTKEEKYSELKFDLADKNTVARNLAKHPELLERPIAVKGNLAVIGRPPENFRKLF